MISSLAALILVLAGIHWLYESVVARSLRMSLKFELFAIRDEARRLERDALTTESSTVAALLCELTDYATSKLEYISLPALLFMNRERLTDPIVEREVNTEIEIVKNLDTPEIRDLFGRAVVVIMKAGLVNSAMFLLYVSPLLPFLLLYLPGRAKGGAETFAYADRAVTRGALRMRPTSALTPEMAV